jgi:hypothetical protein
MLGVGTLIPAGSAVAVVAGRLHTRSVAFGKTRFAFALPRETHLSPTDVVADAAIVQVIRQVIALKDAFALRAYFIASKGTSLSGIIGGTGVYARI